MSAGTGLRSFLSCLLVIASVVVITILRPTEEARAQDPPNTDGATRQLANRSDQAIVRSAVRSIEKGRETFRFDTFGDEAFWGDTLNLHEAIAGAANGGVGPGLTPATALALGLKVDVGALPGRFETNCAAEKSTSTIPRRRSRCCSSTRSSASRASSTGRPADLRRHPVRALPLDRRRLLRARDRPAASTAGRTAT